MKVKSESEVAQSCPTLSDPMDCSLPGSSVHGIFQAKVLEWGAIAFSAVIYQTWYVCVREILCIINNIFCKIAVSISAIFKNLRRRSVKEQNKISHNLSSQLDPFLTFQYFFFQIFFCALTQAEIILQPHLVLVLVWLVCSEICWTCFHQLSAPRTHVLNSLFLIPCSIVMSTRQILMQINSMHSESFPLHMFTFTWDFLTSAMCQDPVRFAALKSRDIKF